MKRTHKPDPIPMRRKEYEVLDGELLSALVDTVQSMQDQGFIVPESMKSIIKKRDSIKRKFQK